MRILVIIICVIVVAALVFTYVMMFPTNAYAETPVTPPPDGMGSTDEYDESTLYFPGDEEEEEEILDPMLMITGGPIRLDIGQTYAIPYIMNDFPEGTLPIWESKNPEVA